MRMSAKKPTMRDIARAVGTSAVTVSKAIAGKPGMSDRLRSRILKKAEEMAAPEHSSTSGKNETVYVIKNGDGTKKTIVSAWLT